MADRYYRDIGYPAILPVSFPKTKFWHMLTRIAPLLCNWCIYGHADFILYFRMLYLTFYGKSAVHMSRSTMYMSRLQYNNSTIVWQFFSCRLVSLVCLK